MKCDRGIYSKTNAALKFVKTKKFKYTINVLMALIYSLARNKRNCDFSPFVLGPSVFFPPCDT